MKFTAIHVVAVNDPDGNPRRGYKLYRDTAYIGFVREGYHGTQALRDALEKWGVPFVQKMDYQIDNHIRRSISITVKEYDALVAGPGVER